MDRRQLAGRGRTFAIHLAHLANKRGIGGKIVGWETGARHLSIHVRLKDNLQLDAALNLADPLAAQTYTNVVIAQRIGGLIVYQFQLAQGLWQNYTRQDLKSNLSVGLAEARREVLFSFDPPHSLFAGTSGSGKSTAVLSTLTGLCSEYAPDKLGLVLIDPENDYKDLENLAHLAAPRANSSEDIDTALLMAEQEYLKRRENDLRDARRFLVVIDEAQDVLEGKRLAIAQALARGGRKYNVNLLIASQKPTDGNLPDLLDNVVNRWVGFVKDGKTSAYLTGQAGLRCHQLTGKGDFIHIAGPEQDRLLVAKATQADFDKLPRAEITAPDLPEEDLSRLYDEPEEADKGGRPPNEIDPEILAYYVAYYGSTTQKWAEEKLGVKRYTHNKYREFVERFRTKVIQIQEAKKNAK